MFEVTVLYLGLNGLFFVALALNVVRLRKKHAVLLGDGGNDELHKAVRAFGNCAEYLPLVIILFAALEFKGVAPVILHAAGIIFILGRIMHGLAIMESFKDKSITVRIFGMAITFSVITMASLWLIYSFFVR